MTGEVVVLAEEATGRALVDQLRDRLRRRLDKAARAGREDLGRGGPPLAWWLRHPTSCRGRRQRGRLSPGVSPRWAGPGR